MEEIESALANKTMNDALKQGLSLLWVGVRWGSRSGSLEKGIFEKRDGG